MDDEELRRLRTQSWVPVETGISREILLNTLSLWAEFFASDVKFCHKHAGESLEGYFPSESEVAVGATNPDPKEYFHIYENTRLPSELRECSSYFFSAAKTVVGGVLESIQRKGYLDRAFGFPADGAHLLRVLQYDDPGKHADLQYLAYPHTDITLLSLVFSLDGSLAVFDSAGVSLQLPELADGHAWLLVGDMLELASGGRFKAAKHAVLAGPGVRRSLVFFGNPRNDEVLVPGITAGQILQNRLAEMSRNAK